MRPSNVHAMRPHALLFALALVACGGEDAPALAPLPGDDQILAEVESTTISQYDLDRALVTTLGPLAEGVDGETRHDVLESLVTSRAIAMAREAELTPEQRAALEREVAAHREQLLVRQYLAQHAPSGPPTDEDIQAYYDAHPERFGARTLRRYEMLLTTRELSDDERTRVLEALREPGSRTDWPSFAAELAARGLPIAHHEGDAEDALLHARLRQLLGTLSTGRASSLTFVEGRAFVLRVTGETERAARPLSEVREDIRRALGPRSVRDSIRAVREDVLEGVRVVYHEPSGSDSTDSE